MRYYIGDFMSVKNDHMELVQYIVFDFLMSVIIMSSILISKYLNTPLSQK
jgi:hypothetical protein